MLDLRQHPRVQEDGRELLVAHRGTEEHRHREPVPGAVHDVDGVARRDGPGLADGVLFSHSDADATVQVSRLARRRFPKTARHYVPFAHSPADAALTHRACKLTAEALHRGVRWFVGPVAGAVRFCAEHGIALNTEQMCRGMYELCSENLVVDLRNFRDAGWFDPEARRAEPAQSWEELVSEHLRLDASAPRVCLRTADRRESGLLIEALKSQELQTQGRDHFFVDFERLLDSRDKGLREKLQELFVGLQLRPKHTPLTVFFASFHLLFREDASETDKDALFFLQHKTQRLVDLCEEKFPVCRFVVDMQAFYADPLVFRGKQFLTLEAADLKAKLQDQFLAFCLADFPHLAHVLEKLSLAEMAHAWGLEFELRRQRAVQASDRAHIERFIAEVEKKKDQAGRGASLSEVIGMSATKTAIRQTVENRLRFEALYRELPIKISTSRPC